VACKCTCSIDKPQPRRTLTDRQTADLIRLAALPPDQRRRALMQLVQQVFSSWKLPLLQQWGVSISPQLLKVGNLPHSLQPAVHWQQFLRDASKELNHCLR
jgi:hypothetical protein